MPVNVRTVETKSKARALLTMEETTFKILGCTARSFGQTIKIHIEHTRSHDINMCAVKIISCTRARFCPGPGRVIVSRFALLIRAPAHRSALTHVIKPFLLIQ